MTCKLPLVMLILLALAGCRRAATNRPNWTCGDEFHKAVSSANRIVVRAGGLQSPREIDRQKILFAINKPAEIRQVVENLRFQSAQTTPSCVCIGYPEIDWCRGKERIAATSVQHCRAIRWKGFPSDAVLTPESQAWLKKWLIEHGVKEESWQIKNPKVQ
jgi:hypothetical protein